MSEPIVDPAYVGFVRRYQPTGYDTPYYLGVVQRLGAARATSICRHNHATPEEADACASKLAAARNGKSE